MSQYLVPNIQRLQQAGKMVDLPEKYIIQYLFSTVIGYLGKRILGMPVDIKSEIQYATAFLTNGLRNS